MVSEDVHLARVKRACDIMARTKISVTVEQSLLDKVARFTNGLSRSEIVERALKRWLTERGRRQLEAEIAVYYTERREDERWEDEEWADLSARHLDKSWK